MILIKKYGTSRSAWYSFSVHQTMRDMLTHPRVNKVMRMMWWNIALLIHKHRESEWWQLHRKHSPHIPFKAKRWDWQIEAKKLAVKSMSLTHHQNIESENSFRHSLLMHIWNSSIIEGWARSLCCSQLQVYSYFDCVEESIDKRDKTWITVTPKERRNEVIRYTNFVIITTVFVESRKGEEKESLRCNNSFIPTSLPSILISVYV
jgi:hypothetical protein